MNEHVRHSGAHGDAISNDTPIKIVRKSSSSADPSLEAIRSILTEDAPAPSKRRASAVDKAVSQAQPSGAAEAAPANSDAPKRRKRSNGHAGGLVSGMVSKIKGYRPTAKHMIVAALGLLVFFRPWLVVGIVMLSLFAFIAGFLILGYDLFWRRAIAFAKWYAARNPERAAIMYKRLDRFALNWDAFLDRFPEGSVDGLYLPDFQELAVADDRHAAALDRRLDNMRETSA